MNSNEIRWNLHNYENLKQDIKDLQDQLEEYRKMEDFSIIKAQVITDMPIHHSNESKVEVLALKRAEYIIALEQELDHKMRVCKAIRSVINFLKYPETDIINWRYLHIPIGQRKLNWVEVGDKVNLCEQACRAVDQRIILKIQNELLSKR